MVPRHAEPLLVRGSKRYRPVGNQARRTGESGWPRDGFQQIDGRVGDPQLQGVVARLEIVGELDLVRLPEADAGALAVYQHLERVVHHRGLEEDPLAREI